ncbi:MAG: ubiquinol-cytochrome c reductase iron-sulfur subunit [Thaumarchaeota archaeon]|nr:ubiquinol-cytochrome c reductase iron-sulfur subunit [Nitrososphaerota archaeon]
MDATRREFIRRVLAASALVGVGGVAIWDLIDGGSNSAGQLSVTLLQASTTQQSTSSGSAQSAQATPTGYVFVTGLAALSGKSSAYFNHPTGGLSVLLSLNSQWKAFNATCTHAPCTVNYAGSQIQCPCHGAVFDPSNGNVLSGPAPTRLPQYDVLVQGNSLYVSNRIVN